MRKQALINVEETDVRVAFMEDDQLVELFVEDMNQRSKIGNIYKGRVESIVPGLKAVFVNIGIEKNAFLHFNDVLPEYDLPERGRPERQRASAVFVQDVDDDDDEPDDYVDPAVEGAQAEKPVPRPPKKSRQLRVGDEILVQVTKEEISTKGARITTYISLPGRYLVLMPFSESGGGVSRRIEDGSERKRLRELLRSIKPDQGSFIIRTAGLEEDEEAIRRDAELLQKGWGQILRRSTKARTPSCLHNDQEILTRVVRDNFTEDIDEILIDSKQAMRELIKSCEEMVPELCPRIQFYASAQNIFDVFEVEKQFQKALKRKVWLRSGGAIIIDETEALTAIDVNSGKFVGHGDDQETVILKTNLEACRAIARQLRLRDLGGLIVIDFIDMKSRENELQVMREFKRCLRSDRAKYSVSDFSEFGLVQMTRKRVRKSLASAMYRPCPYCEGSGRIINEAQLWKQLKYDLMAELEKLPKPAATERPRPVDIVVHSHLKTYLQNNVQAGLKVISGRYRVALRILGNPELHHEQIKIITQVESDVKDKRATIVDAHAEAPEAPEKRLESAAVAHHNAS